jgi:hypothetical protein
MRLMGDRVIGGAAGTSGCRAFGTPAEKLSGQACVRRASLRAGTNRNGTGDVEGAGAVTDLGGCTPWKRLGLAFGRALEGLLLGGGQLLERGLKRDVFGHRSTDSPNGLAHLLADLVVRLESVLLARDAFPRDFLVSLSRPERIGREFRASHAIDEIVLRGELLFDLDFLQAAPAVRPL